MSAQLLDIRRLHEISQVIAWKALSAAPQDCGPYVHDLEPVDQDDDDQEAQQ